MKRLRRAIGKFLNLDRRPTLRGALLALVGESQPIFLDYAVTPTPRWGYGRPAHPQLHAVLEAGRSGYERFLREVLSQRSLMAKISSRADPGRPHEPAWENPWLLPIDAAALYGVVATRKPKRYVEIGSGTSTAFARKAARDSGAGTHITSIDPAPRSHVDRLCDSIIRRRLEDVDLGLFDQLGRGDVVFMDGSHRVFTNSDATVFLLEVLPRLRPGLLVHVHDVFLPYDYPPDWSDRFYSEQYLLAAYLLSHRSPFKVLFPSSFVSRDNGLRMVLAPLWESIGINAHGQGGSFWVETARPR